MKALKHILRTGWNDIGSDLHPIDRRMDVLAQKKVRGMSTENIRYLINEIVREYVTTGYYLEVGMFHGCSLLSAALFNPGKTCIGIDNFSQFDAEKENRKALKRNLEKFSEAEKAEIVTIEGDYKDVLDKFEHKIDVYFYDGKHTYYDQLNGLQLALPHLSKKCVIIVDDVNLERTTEANKKFIKDNPDFKSWFKVSPPTRDARWHNGVEVIGRGWE
jgi:predicted O-methyltransferase YrrM